MRIPETPRVESFSAPRLRPVPVQAGMGEHLERFGAEISALAGQWKRRQDNNDFVAAQNAYTLRMSEWTRKAETERQGEKARDITKDWRGQHSEISEDIVANSGFSVEAGEAFRLWAGGREAVGLDRVAQYEHQQLQLYGQDQHALRVQEQFQQVEQTPENWRDALQQMEEGFALAVDQGVYRPEEALARYRDMEGKLKAGAFDGMYAVNRHTAMKELGSFGFGEAVDAKLRNRYNQDNEHEARVAESKRNEAVRLVWSKSREAQEMAELTGNTVGLLDLAEKLDKLGDAELGNELRNHAARVDNERGTILQAQTMTARELAEKLGGMEAEMAAAGQAQDLERARQISDEADVYARTYKNKISQLDKDPAAAVDVMAFGETPADKAQSRLALQEKEGVPLGGRKPLTMQEETQMREAWNRAGVDERAAMLPSFAEFGDAAPLVLAQLGIGAAEQDVLAVTLQNPGNAIHSNAMIAAMAVPKENLPKITVSKEIAQVRTDSAAFQVYQAMAWAMPNASTTGSLHDYEEAAERLLKINGGNVEKALAMLDAGRESLVSNRYALFVPFGENADKVESHLDTMLGKNLDEFLKGRADLDERMRRDEALRLRSVGIWTNTPDGKSFILLDPVAQAPVVDSTGKPFMADINTKLMETPAMGRGFDWLRTR